ncbi:MAG: lytic transglycosylase domain-containing protein [Bacteroidia bacterium]|nr:lytic transglycosylase domain-containing protein [Bacteroidia bacterium]NNC86754.1 lytic transglycosylase domain-containing protein [Bacteroidia bacterium]NNM15366.1 lytic transglycosylase domain-containing protein [Bacteroidia bacterium]
MKKFYSFIIIATLLFAAAKFFTFSSENSEDTRQIEFSKNYNIYALNIPKQIYFAGERVPVEIYDVKERLDKELLVNTYWQSRSMLMHKKAARYFPIIEPILAKNNIPDDFKYVVVAESGFEHVVSPAGAAGYWQFLKATGREYGLEVNSGIDERYHIEKSTEAACKYIQQAKDRLGTWTLAAASFNMGMDGLKRRLSNQKVDSYYKVLLNSETSRYVFRILSYKEIIGSPEKYGFNFNESDLYQPLEYSVVTVNNTVEDLVAFANDHGTDYKNIKIMNPWIRGASLPNNSRRTYQIKIMKPFLSKPASEPVPAIEQSSPEQKSNLD